MLADRCVVTHSNADGQWKTSLAALPAGGPHELVVGCGDETWRITDVLVGDVWVCSGQSNMWWPLSLCEGGSEHAEDLPALRFLNVDELPALEPAADWIRAPEWRRCTVENAGRMSGVAYYFSQRQLEAHPEVPIGIVLVAVGGTRIETWMSPDALAAAGVPAAARSRDEDHEFRIKLEAFVAGLSRQDIETVPEKIRAFAELATDGAAWPVMDLPCCWQDAGLKFNGVVWFRREVEIAASWSGHTLQLSLGACDKCERTYLNGHEIGRTDIHNDPTAWAGPRLYTVPANLIRPGKNVIAVRVFSHVFGGGMTGPAAAMTLISPSGETIPLHGAWHYQVESNFGAATSLHDNQPSYLWNGMVAPLTTFPALGVLWYQGESNADDPTHYKRLFPAMISDWRAKWGDVVLPFFFVQLPGFGPGETWPELRAAQAEALGLPGTAMAVAIDQGDAEDVHPTKKREVGKRLALLALKHFYGQDKLITEGPTVLEIKRTEPQSLEICFANAEGLHFSGSSSLAAFESAGNDGIYVALPPGFIVGCLVRLTKVPADAKYLRFGWEACPMTHLINHQGLPAAPFCASIHPR